MPLFNPPVIAGPIGGGTAGSVLFVGTGGLFAQDNANLFWDDTNNRLGIGTTSPGSALHVAGNARLLNGATPTVLRVFSSDDGAGNTNLLYVGSNGVGFFVAPQITGSASALDLTVGPESVSRLGFQTSGVLRARFTTGGHLEWPTSNTYDIGQSGAVPRDFFLGRQMGIGTAAPVASAQIEGVDATRGWLPPRWTTTQKNAIGTPATGLYGYDTTRNEPYYYNGTAWVPFSLGSAAMALSFPLAQGGAGTTQIVAASVGNKHKIVGGIVTLSAAGTIKFTDGAGDLTGAMDVAASSGFVIPAAVLAMIETSTTNTALSIVTTGGAAKGVIRYLTEP